MDARSLKLSIHHVGGRSGSRAFPHLPYFEPDIINCLYEADPSCVEQIRQKNAGLESELYVLPFLLWKDDHQELTLNITYDPFASSVYELNPAYRRWHYPYPAARYDYPFESALTTMERVTVCSRTFDSLYCHQPTSEALPPPPDFLSLDTQGSEFEILLGAKRVLREHILAVATEVEFHELYRGQHLFDDVFKVLREASFLLTDLTLAGCSPFRAPACLRADSFKIMGDGLFLRDIEQLPAQPGSAEWILQAKKLAFLALVFHRVEYALMILKWLGELGALTSRTFGDRVNGREMRYLRFLDEFWASVRQGAYPLRRTFADVYTFAASKARFEASPARNGSSHLRNRVKQILGFLPGALPLVKVVLGLLRRARRALASGAQHLWWYLSIRDLRATPTERVLKKYGLHELARKLRRSRKACALAARG